MTVRQSIVLFILTLVLATGCGMVKTGTSARSTDPEPAGTVVAQGTFVGQNGRNVSGLAQVYQKSDGSYIIRLQSLSAPSESGLYVWATINSQSTLLQALKAVTGDQNYEVSNVANGSSWTLVEIRSHLTNPTLAYGAATLQTP